MNLLRVIICLSVFLFSFSSLAQERILNYIVQIDVQEDASLDITEQIQVVAEGNKIKRGVYRDIPTSFMDRAGTKHQTPILVQSVYRDNQKIPFSTKTERNNWRVYMGSMAQSLQKGVYTYTLKYKIFNAISDMKHVKTDELYWNVIGQEWLFNIEKSFITINFPNNASFKSIEIYTGQRDSRENISKHQVLGSTVQISIDETLPAKSGVTALIDMPQGYIKHLPFYKLYLQVLMIRVEQFFKYNTLQLCLFGFLLLGMGVFFFITWYLYGQDPTEQAVFPRFDEIKECSTALLCRIFRPGDSSGALALHFLDLEKRGFLSMEFTKKYVNITKLKTKEPEKNKEDHLYKSMGEAVYKIPGQNVKLEKYFSALDRILDLESKRFVTHNYSLQALYTFLNIICFFICLAFMGYWEAEYETYVLFLMVVGLSTILIPFVLALSWVLNRDKRWAIGFIVITSLVITFIADDIIVGLLLALLLSNLFSYIALIPKFSFAGARLQEHFRGIEMFLKTTDDMRYKTLDQEKIEKLLPYAVILGMETRWLNSLKALGFTVAPFEESVQRYHTTSDFSQRSISAVRNAQSGFSGGYDSSDGGGGCSGGGGGGGGGGGF